MKSITEILANENPSVEDLIQCFEIVRKNGDVAMIKLDGERSENHYTILITFPTIKGKGMLRVDEDDLTTAMKKILHQYNSK